MKRKNRNVVGFIPPNVLSVKRKVPRNARILHQFLTAKVAVQQSTMSVCLSVCLSVTKVEIHL